MEGLALGLTVGMTAEGVPLYCNSSHWRPEGPRNACQDIRTTMSQVQGIMGGCPAEKSGHELRVGVSRGTVATGGRVSRQIWRRQ